MPKPLSRSFFARHHLDVARELVGCRLAHGPCAGIVVETEAYAIEGDPACHTASRPSSRRFVRAQRPGDAYVYLNYGMYWLLNVLAADGIVLVRALEPTEGIGTMRRRRGRTRLTDLCSGPGKLAMALEIGPGHHGSPLVGRLTVGPVFTVGNTEWKQAGGEVLADVRVGISQAVEFPWRFLAAGNPHVSVAHGKVRAHSPRRTVP